MMDCREARARLGLWERGGIEGEEGMLQLLAHIEGCPDCLAASSALIPLLRRDAGLGAEAGRGAALAAAVMSRIREEGLEPSARAKPDRSLLGVTSRFSRALVAAIAAVLALGIGLGLYFSIRDAGTVTVRFVLDAPEASMVAVAGDFNGWETVGYELRRAQDGSWELELKLHKGKFYSYNFVVDGQRWIPDPSSPEKIDDGFGGTSSLLRI
jgi:hypothetical protein